jgi:hypothetical protein
MGGVGWRERGGGDQGEKHSAPGGRIRPSAGWYHPHSHFRLTCSVTGTAGNRLSVLHNTSPALSPARPPARATICPYSLPRTLSPS